MSENMIKIEDFCNFDTLNIFTDASIYGRGHSVEGCFGAVCVHGYNIIDSCFRILSETTNNNSEIKGIRIALSLANKWKSNFKVINIFSDSQISVFGLRDYIYGWFKNKRTNGYLTSSSGNIVANQSEFIECHYILEELALYPNCIIRIYHQNGHIDSDNLIEIKRAANTFKTANKLNGKVDYNLIRYISGFNDYVDKTSRSILRNNKVKGYINPIQFMPKGGIRRI